MSPSKMHALLRSDSRINGSPGASSTLNSSNGNPSGGQGSGNSSGNKTVSSLNPPSHHFLSTGEIAGIVTAALMTLLLLALAVFFRRRIYDLLKPQNGRFRSNGQSYIHSGTSIPASWSSTSAAHNRKERKYARAAQYSRERVSNERSLEPPTSTDVSSDDRFHNGRGREDQEEEENRPEDGMRARLQAMEATLTTLVAGMGLVSHESAPTAAPPAYTQHPNP